MSVASALLNAQRRPEAEARRFTEAVAAALSTGEAGPDVSAFLSAAETLDRVNEEIAEEKSPRPAAPAPGHVEQFDDQVTETFDDDGGIPLLPNTHRSDARYLLGADDDDHGDDVEQAQVDVAAEWGAPIDGDESGGEAADLDVEPARPDETGRVPWEQDASSADAIKVDPQQDADEEPAHNMPRAAAAGPESDPAGRPEDGDGDQEPAPDRAGVPQWEWNSGSVDARTTSPWGDAQELVASLPAPVVVPEPEEASGDVTEDPPTPSSHATEPPSSFDEPEPESGPSLRTRIGEVLSDQRRQLRVDPKASAKKIGIALAAVILVAVVILSFTGGGRGKPPDPADAEAPPPQVENTTPPVKEVTLVPATVSTSCGNDSDAVAPFSNEKTRAWKCNRINGLDLNVLNVTFNKLVVITSITIVPGFNYIAPDGRDEWSRHRVVTDVSWRMGGGLYPQEHILPTRTGVTQKFPDVRTLMMSMTITGSARPPVGKASNKGSFGEADDAQDPKKVDETTAVSKIVITGYPVESDGGGLTAPSAGG